MTHRQARGADKHSTFRYVLSAILLIVLAFSTVSQRQSVGLVLSGGGAKGIAHAGVIQALEDNEISVDYITGTSMGAIMGGLYCCGYSPAEMMTLLESEAFSYWSTGKTEPSMNYFFASEAASPQMFSFPIKLGKDKNPSRQEPPASIINPIPMSYAFVELFEAYSAQCGGDFNKLFVPFRCVASNVGDNHAQVLSRGRLEDCIRASMSFPIVFQPIEVEGNLLYDGGIYDNFPVNVMRKDFAPDIMIGVDVSSGSDSLPSSILSQLDYLVMRDQSYDVPEDEGIKIRVHLDQFALLDFEQAEAIYKVGYETAMSMMDSIKARVHSRTPAETLRIRREVFKRQTPQVAYASVDVTGGTRKQNEYIESLFAPDKNQDTISINRARSAYYSAVSTGQIQNFRVYSDYDKKSGLFNLKLHTTVKPNLSAAVGGYITSSANSYLYARLGYNSLSFNTLSASLAAWVGQSYMAGLLRARLNIHGSGLPTALGLEAAAIRRRYAESDKIFFMNEPSFTVNHQYYGKLYWGTSAGRNGIVRVGLGGGRLFNSFYQSTDPESFHTGRDHIAYNLGQVFAEYESTTLDDLNYPTTGYEARVNVAGAMGKSRFHNSLVAGPAGDETRDEKWIQGHARYQNYLRLSDHWVLGLRGETLLSTRKLPQNYYAAMSATDAYTPTPSTDNAFNTSLRANSYLAAGLTPVYKFNDKLSIRLTGHVFAPLRPIVHSGEEGDFAAYSKWFGRVRFFGELSGVYHLPIGSLSAYVNYIDNPGRKYNFGLTLGIYLPAPTFF